MSAGDDTSTNHGGFARPPSDHTQQTVGDGQGHGVHGDSALPPNHADWALDRRSNAMLASAITGAFLIILAWWLPMPFVIGSPGPTANVLANEPEVIKISGHETYDSRVGELDLVTVSIAGGPGYETNLLRMLSAVASDAKTVRPLRAVYPEEQSGEDTRDVSQAEMSESQISATAAALGYLNIPYSIAPRIVGFSEEGNAAEVFDEGDILRTIEGVEVTDLDSVRRAGDSMVAGEPSKVRILRDGSEQTVELVPYRDEETQRTLLGIIVESSYEFPFDVEIAAGPIGGPSAGMVFALGLIEELTPEDLVTEHVTGTGTISASGQVGPIGSIELKMLAAKRDGADYFLAPQANCPDVRGHEVPGLQVIKVDTLDDAVEALEAIRDGDAEDLPDCALAK